jgi:anhydro-N-acetylmuramic acid kinase
VIAARWAFPWSRTFGPRICWPAARARRWFRCSTMCSLPTPKRGRVLQNIGGIANLTAIPAGAGTDQVIAFDTGPGNMVIDALAQEALRQTFDRNGGYCRQAQCLRRCWAEALRNPYFQLKPPRTAGASSLAASMRRSFCRLQRHSSKPEDALAQRRR